MKATPVRATTLSPYHYGHLAIQGGVATIPEFIGDRAVAFGLCLALGMMREILAAARYGLPRAPGCHALAHVRLPYAHTAPSAPLARRSDLGVEGGYPDRVRRAASSGNFKEYFLIQEVPPGQQFHGAVFGQDPFELAGSDQIVTRIGVNRTGMLLLERGDAAKSVRLNAATAALFSRDLRMERYVLHHLQLSAPLKLEDAALEVAQWTV